MNKRARYARRVLREHRRRPHMYVHTDDKRQRFWICPRCEWLRS